MKTFWTVILTGLLALLGAGLVALIIRPLQGAPVRLLPAPTPAPIQVYVTGAINQPGVYSLPVNSRVKDAIAAAGGLAVEANEQALQLAAILQDGQNVVVPTRLAPQTSIPAAQSQRSGALPLATAQVVYPIDINHASAQELETLPEIGPKTAEKIIAYRQEHGGFKKIEEIQNVAGIGPATFEQIKGLITVLP